MCYKYLSIFYCKSLLCSFSILVVYFPTHHALECGAISSPRHLFTFVGFFYGDIFCIPTTSGKKIQRFTLRGKGFTDLQSYSTYYFVIFYGLFSLIQNIFITPFFFIRTMFIRTLRLFPNIKNMLRTYLRLKFVKN